MAVRFSLPSTSLFRFPPSNNSHPAPPLLALQYDPPALDVAIPVTISCLYAVSVKLLNSLNQSRGSCPWSISKTKVFLYFVVAHNIILASYSAWTFIGMFRTLYRTIRSPKGPTGTVGFVDSLCKIHGTSGLGNGTAYPHVCLQPSHSPHSSSDFANEGRLWDEGLEFYGHIFYWSKMYEFVDTGIILAKGRQGSFLQVYHHIGALICMWAGMRYMSSPIWIPTFVNSGVHALMYSYYSLTALRIPVPKFVKLGLTVLQIIQLLFSDVFAALHLFISYDIPVEDAGVKTSIIMASLDPKAILAARPHRIEVPCIDTSGQAFAIWLSVLYLTPLIGMFIRFFYYSYRRVDSKEVKMEGRKAEG